MSDPLAELLAELDDDTARLRRWGATDRADVIEEIVRRVRAARDEERGQLVNLTEAAAISGFSPRHLRNLIRDGRLQDRGEKYAPRLRVGDLPRKPAASNGSDGWDPREAAARAVGGSR